jgi:hypothetical protein
MCLLVMVLVLTGLGARNGYTLSVRSDSRCKHYIIEQTKESPSRYLLQGRAFYTDSLAKLIQHYVEHSVDDHGGSTVAVDPTTLCS